MSIRVWLGFTAVALALAACEADRVESRSGDAGTDAPGADAAARATDAGTDAPFLYFGAPCQKDEHCGQGLRCLKEDADDLAPGLGGPPGGLCSRSCTTDSDCAGGAQATCVSPFGGGPPFCLPACTPGASDAPERKCLGRYDLACQSSPADPLSGMCVPACGGSADCHGSPCDLGTGLCVRVAPVGAPIGADCTSGRCSGGVCIGEGDQQVCSGFCTLGTAGCGFDPTSPERLDAYCLASPEVTSAQHDLGLCIQLCDCDGDCRHAGFVCDPAPADSAIVRSVRGRRGGCFPNDGTHVSTPCASDGGSRDAAAPLVDAAAPDASRDSGQAAPRDAAHSG